MVALAGQIVFSFGLAAFASLFVLWFRQPAERRAHSPYGFPFLYSSLWFGANLWTTDFALLLAAASGFPAVLLHLFRLPGVPLTALAGAVPVLWLWRVGRDGLRYLRRLRLSQLFLPRRSGGRQCAERPAGAAASSCLRVSRQFRWRSMPGRQASGCLFAPFPSAYCCSTATCAGAFFSSISS